MSWKQLVVGFSLALGTAYGNDAGSWPQFRGQDGQGHADGAKLPVTWSTNQNITWRTELPGKGWSSPVIWGNQIWMTTATEGGRSLRALCVDKATGKLLRDVEVFSRQAPLEVHDKNSHASPTPVIEAGRVYVHFGSAGTACLETETGKILWRSTELQVNHLVGPGSSPMLYRELLIVPFDGTNVQYVAALHKDTGTLAWKTARTGQMNSNGDFNKAFSTPLVVNVAGQDQVVVTGANWTHAYEPLTGKELWRVGYKGFSNTPRPVTGHGLVYIFTGFTQPQLFAIRLGGRGDVTASHIAWKCEKYAPLKPSPILVSDRLYTVSDTSMLTCFNAKTGEVLWQHRLSGNFSASPIFANGRLYFSSEEGKVSVVSDGLEFKLLSANVLNERLMASPAVSGNAIFLRTDKAIYRVEELK